MSAYKRKDKEFNARLAAKADALATGRLTRVTISKPAKTSLLTRLFNSCARAVSKLR